MKLSNTSLLFLLPALVLGAPTPVHPLELNTRDTTYAIVYGDSNNRRGCFLDPNFDHRVGWLIEGATFRAACWTRDESGDWFFVAAYSCYTYGGWVNERCKGRTASSSTPTRSPFSPSSKSSPTYLPRLPVLIITGQVPNCAALAGCPPCNERLFVPCRRDNPTKVELSVHRSGKPLGASLAINSSLAIFFFIPRGPERSANNSELLIPRISLFAGHHLNHVHRHPALEYVALAQLYVFVIKVVQ
jgi:hypothetical protein